MFLLFRSKIVIDNTSLYTRPPPFLQSLPPPTVVCQINSYFLTAYLSFFFFLCGPPYTPILSLHYTTFPQLHWNKLHLILNRLLPFLNQFFPRLSSSNPHQLNLIVLLFLLRSSTLYHIITLIFNLFLDSTSLHIVPPLLFSISTYEAPPFFILILTAFKILLPITPFSSIFIVYNYPPYLHYFLSSSLMLPRHPSHHLLSYNSLYLQSFLSSKDRLTKTPISLTLPPSSTLVSQPSSLSHPSTTNHTSSNTTAHQPCRRPEATSFSSSLLL